MPAMLELRIRACHVRGSFECKDNVAPQLSHAHLIDEPAGFDYMRLAHPPVTFRHEKLKVEQRIPAAQALHRRARPQRTASTARAADVGLIVQGGLYNALMRALQQLGLADAFGDSEHSAAGAQRHLPAGAGARSPTSAPASARCWWSRKASPSTSSRTSRTLLRRLDMQTAAARQGPAAARPASTPSR